MEKSWHGGQMVRKRGRVSETKGAPRRKHGGVTGNDVSGEQALYVVLLVEWKMCAGEEVVRRSPSSQTERPRDKVAY